MVVRLNHAVEALAAAVRGHAPAQPAAAERFQGVVHGGQGQPRASGLELLKNLLSGRVTGIVAKQLEDGQARSGNPQTGGVQTVHEYLERGESLGLFHSRSNLAFLDGAVNRVFHPMPLSLLS